MRGWLALLGKRLRDHGAILVLGAVLIATVCFTTVYLNSKLKTAQQLEHTWGMLLHLLKNITGQDAPDRAQRISVPRFVALAYLSVMTQVALIAFPIAVAARGLAGEVTTGTADLLLAQPLRRGALYCVNVVVILIGAVVFAAVSFLTIEVCSFYVQTIEPLPADRFAWVALNAMSLSICTGGIALLFSAGTSVYGRAVLGPCVVMLSMGVFELMGSLWRVMDGARFFGLYFYYNPLHIADGQVHRMMAGWIGPRQWAMLASGILLGVGVLFGFIGYLVFRRRDIATT